MSINKKIFTKLFILLFGLSISITVIPCGLINSYGLFGEVNSSVVTQTKQAGTEEVSVLSEKHSSIRGECIYNIWLEIAIVILCLIFMIYMFRLPQGETIVTLKVRMDN